MRSTLTNLANMFRVPDLRNKVLFTLLIICVYRLGANIPCPGHRLQRRAVAGGVGAARRRGQLPQPVLRRGPHQVRGVRAGDHAVHHQLDHHPAADGGHPQVRAVARGGGGGPEEADPGHPLPDHRPGHPAVHRAGLRLPQRRRRPPRRRVGPQHRPDPEVHRAPGAADRADHDRRHRRGHVAGRAHHPARGRPGHVGPDLHQRGGDHAFGWGGGQGRSRGLQVRRHRGPVARPCWWPSSSSSRVSGVYPSPSPSGWSGGACTAVRAPTSR